MKVLFVINAFGKPSGAEHVLIDYLKSDKRIEPEFLIIGPHAETLSLFEQITDRKNIYYINAYNKITSPVSRFLLFRVYRYTLCKIIRKTNVYKKLNKERTFDIVYYNNSFESMTFYSLFPGCKKIIHIHDMIDMFRPAQKECVVSVTKKAKQVIAASDACGKMLCKNGVNPQKISVAHNSIHIVPQPFIKNLSNTLTIGFVGSAIHRKGFDLFVRIINEVDNQIKSNDYTINKIKTVVISNSDQNSTFLRDNIKTLYDDIDINEYYNLPREEVLSLYNDLDLLLVPSRYDPLPTVVLEAYLLGIPVIGTAKDGMLEMQVEPKMMFGLGDVEGAVKRILNWITLPHTEKAEIVAKTQKHIRLEFTAEKKKNMVYSTIEKVIDGE